ncbi:hypothetical protein AAC387_Pa07g1966 [Persea americana]
MRRSPWIPLISLSTQASSSSGVDQRPIIFISRTPIIPFHHLAITCRTSNTIILHLQITPPPPSLLSSALSLHHQPISQPLHPYHHLFSSSPPPSPSSRNTPSSSLISPLQPTITSLHHLDHHHHLPSIASHHPAHPGPLPDLSPHHQNPSSSHPSASHLIISISLTPQPIFDSIPSSLPLIITEPISRTSISLWSSSPSVSSLLLRPSPSPSTSPLQALCPHPLLHLSPLHCLPCNPSHHPTHSRSLISIRRTPQASPSPSPLCPLPAPCNPSSTIILLPRQRLQTHAAAPPDDQQPPDAHSTIFLLLAPPNSFPPVLSLSLSSVILALRLFSSSPSPFLLSLAVLLVDQLAVAASVAGIASVAVALHPDIAGSEGLVLGTVAVVPEESVDLPVVVPAEVLSSKSAA